MSGRADTRATNPLPAFDSAAGVEALLRICARPGRILVLMQNNPDPDAIASAMAVRHLVRARLNKRIAIGYGGALGRAENRAMVHELRVDIRRIDPAQLAGYTTLCLVDTQPRAGNNALFTSRPADIVIDHHRPPNRPLWQAELCDVRPDYGATATILFEYLRAADVKLTPSLATALFYGVQSDTQELGREAGAADVNAYHTLMTLANKRALARIRRAPVSTDYFIKLHESLTNAVVAGSAVVTLIRNCDNADMFAEVADLMLRLKGMRMSVCYGPCGNILHLSARAIDARGNAAERMKRVVSGLGTGGGHRCMAGGQIPISADVERQIALVHARILRQFARNAPPRPLLP